MDDPDGDGAFNFEEAQARTSPRNPDSFVDAFEVYDYNLQDPVTLSYGVYRNGTDFEAIHGVVSTAGGGWPGFPVMTPVSTADWDGDEMPNVWEYRHQLALRDPADAAYHYDSDDLANLLEFQIGTYPRISDTDNDGWSDNDEDADGDGLTNLLELQLNTSLTNSDTDGDGVSDGQEVLDGTNPLDSASSLTGIIGLHVYTELK